MDHANVPASGEADGLRTLATAAASATATSTGTCCTSGSTRDEVSAQLPSEPAAVTVVAMPAAPMTASVPSASALDHQVGVETPSTSSQTLYASHTHDCSSYCPPRSLAFHAVTISSTICFNVYADRLLPVLDVFYCMSCASVQSHIGGCHDWRRHCIDDAAAADTIWSVKERVFAANRKFPALRQRLMYRPGLRGISPLANGETLGGAGVAQDGSAVIDVLLADLTAAERKALGPQVWLGFEGFTHGRFKRSLLCCTMFIF